MATRRCSLCEQPYYALGRCVMHYARLRRRRRRERVEIAPTVAYIRKLNDFGWSYGATADAAQIPHGTLVSVIRGEVRTILKERADRILALPTEYQNSKVRVPFAGTARRLSAFNHEGYATVAIARLIGCHVSVFRNATLRQGQVESRFALAVAQAYAQWNGGVDAEGRPRVLPGWPAPSPTERKRARNRGAVPAAAWDGADMDDPAAEPSGYQAEARRGFERRIHLDEVDYLRQCGMTDEQIAERLGVEVGSIKYAEYRARKQAHPEEEVA